MLLEVGRIVKPHGIRGEVIVDLVTNRPERVAAGSVLSSDAGDLEVVRSSPHQNRWIVAFNGVADRNGAEELRGTVLRAEALEGEDDTLWVHELVGALVYDIDGLFYGRVREVEANPASDLLVLPQGLVPLTFVVDQQAGRVVIDPPDGLIEPRPPIEVVDCDPSWPALFEAEATRLREALGDIALRIEHVGSTAVPGLAAKPTVDIQVSVAALEPMATYRGTLELLGYEHMPDQRFPEHRFFGWPAAVQPRTFNLHVRGRKRLGTPSSRLSRSPAGRSSGGGDLCRSQAPTRSDARERRRVLRRRQVRLHPRPLMRVDVFTCLPQLLEPVLSGSLLGKARETGVVDVRVHDLRDYTTDRHRSVDDTPFGGGPGMVLAPAPIFRAVEAVDPPRPLFLLGPGGRRFDQPLAAELAAGEGFSLLCGRYEGVDERVRDHGVDDELSIGDYVLAGGEVAALVVVEAVTRLVPGVMGNEASADDESFAHGLLEYPHFTRPAEFRGWEVPEILRSGDHGRVARWRRAQSLARTLARRPDLFEARGGLSDDDRALLREFGLE